MKPSPLFSLSWGNLPDLRTFLAWRLASVVEAWWQKLPPLQLHQERMEPLEQSCLTLRRRRGDRPVGSTVYWSAIALQLTHRLSASSDPDSEWLPQIAQELVTVWNQANWNHSPPTSQQTAHGSTILHSDGSHSDGFHSDGFHSDGSHSDGSHPDGANLTQHVVRHLAPDLDDRGGLNTLWQHCLAEAMPNGMVAVRVSDAGLAWWLNGLVEGNGLWNRQSLPLPVLKQSSLELPSKLPLLEAQQGGQTAFQSPLSPKALFSIQAAHARCCSLLRLADQEGLLTLASSAAETGNTWAIAHPYPFPWLQADQTLWLTHSAERLLIAQLLTTFESSQSPLPQVLRLAGELAQAFQKFYAACRIFGEVKTQAPELAQARLGLVWVTRLVLHWLLSDELNAIAPTEL